MTHYASIYVASRASNPARVAMWRQLKEQGANIVSSWIHQNGPVADYSELWMRIAAEMKIADKLVLFVEPEDFPLKGAFVEAGMAIALGKPVVIVCPNVVLNDDLSPIGSWANHPLVSFENDIHKAVFNL